MESKRKLLHVGMTEDGLEKTYEEFVSTYFSDSTGVKKLFDVLTARGDFDTPLKDFYTKFCCDLTWAKETTYCGGSGGGGSTRTLHQWVPDCVKNNFKPPGTFANVPNKDEVFYTDNWKDKWFFNKNGNFKFERLSNGEVFTGSWECESDGNCLIKTTEDKKQMSTKDMKWVNQPNRSGGGGGSSSGCQSLSSSQKKPESFFNIKFPGDTKYSYGKLRNGEWFAINNVTKTQFNLTACGYNETIQNLNIYGKPIESPQKTEPNKVTSPPNTEVNVAVVEPNTKNPVVTPENLPNSDKVLPGQEEEMSATNKL